MIAVRKQPRQDDEAIAEIAETLKPWRPPWGKEEVLRVIGLHVYQMRDHASNYWSRDAIIRNRDNAKNVIKLIAELKRRLFTVRIWYEKGGFLLANDDPLLARLEEISEMCGDVAGEHREDTVKSDCATSAYRLIKLCSIDEPTNGSVNAPLRVIAGRLYTMLNPGMVAPGLRRACGDELRSWSGRRERARMWQSEREAWWAAQLDPKNSWWGKQYPKDWAAQLDPKKSSAL